MNTSRLAASGAFAAYMLGLLLVFVGERVVAGTSVVRAIVTLLGIVAITGVTAFRWRNVSVVRRTKTRDAVQIERMMAILCSVGLFAILLYFLTAQPVADWVGIGSLQAATRRRVDTVITVVWVILLLLSVVPQWFAELALLPMRDAAHVEWRRVRGAAQAGLTLAFAASYGSLLVYVADELDVRGDYSFFKTSTPSESTIAMTKNLTDQVQVLTFFPPVNDVHDEVMGYLRELQAKAPGIDVQVHDRLVSPELAEKMHVTEDGVIVVVREKQSEIVELGTKMERARQGLKTLDSKVQQALGKVLRNQRVAYLTVGHGELNDTRRDGAEQGRSARGVRELLQMQNYDIRDLGLVQGLGRDVPEDATMLLVLGATEPFAIEELKSIKRYLTRGGRALIALEPEGKSNNAPLASMVGLEFDPAVLCHSENHGIRRRNESDQAIIFSNRFASHPAVATLARLGSRAVFFIGAGSFTKAEKANESFDVSFVLNSLPATWADTNGNFLYDSPGDKMGIFRLVGAITQSIPAAKQEQQSDEPPGQGTQQRDGDEHEVNEKPNKADTLSDSDVQKDKGATAEAKQMRALMVADSDALSDATLMNPSNFNGNPQFVVDAIRWLAGDEGEQGVIESSDDVRIQHTKQQDKAYFYLTIFGAPALVLGVGLWLSRRWRRRGERSKA